ncbi:MAG TPA: hypothetical protein VIV11_24675 [Kofleriaceae bacterium]
MRSSSIILTCFALAACGHTPTPAERWFAERGKHNPTWHTCTRMGAELRAACGSDPACASKVTRELTRPCYAGRYDQETSDATPSSEARPERLSPCFWDREPTRATSATEYAQRTCSGIVEARLQPACIAELREVIEGICAEGAIDLTGAGP